jgi:hypothetical protein
MTELRDAKGEWTRAHDTASATASRDAKAKIAAEKRHYIGAKPAPGADIALRDPDKPGELAHVRQSPVSGHVRVDYADGRHEDIPARFVDHPTGPNAIRNTALGHFGDIEAGELPRSLDRAKALAELQDGMDLQGRFVPDLARAQHVKYVMFKDDNEDAETLPDNTIAIAPVLLLASQWADDPLSKEQTGWFTPSDPDVSPVVKAESHEMGHVVASYLGVEARTDMPMWSAVAKSMGTMMPASEYRPGADVANWFGRNNDAIAKGVSGYGATSLEEMMAELWAEYTTSSNPRQAAKIYGDYVRANLSATRQFSQETA